MKWEFDANWCNSACLCLCEQVKVSCKYFDTSTNELGFRSLKLGAKEEQEFIDHKLFLRSLAPPKPCLVFGFKYSSLARLITSMRDSLRYCKHRRINCYKKDNKTIKLLSNLLSIFLLLTLASWLTVGLEANSTSVAFNIVFSSNIVAWDWLCPKGFFPYRHW